MKLKKIINAPVKRFVEKGGTKVLVGVTSVTGILTPISENLRRYLFAFVGDAEYSFISYSPIDKVKVGDIIFTSDGDYEIVSMTKSGLKVFGGVLHLKRWSGGM